MTDKVEPKEQGKTEEQVPTKQIFVNVATIKAGGENLPKEFPVGCRWEVASTDGQDIILRTIDVYGFEMSVSTNVLNMCFAQHNVPVQQ